jgi:hypothetical protein
MKADLATKAYLGIKFLDKIELVFAHGHIGDDRS